MPAFTISYDYVAIVDDATIALDQTRLIREVCRALGFDTGMAKISAPLSSEELSRLRLVDAVAKQSRERFGPEADDRQLDLARVALVKLADGNIAGANLILDALREYTGAVPRVIAQALHAAGRLYDPVPPPPSPGEDGPGVPER